MMLTLEYTSCGTVRDNYWLSSCTFLVQCLFGNSFLEVSIW